MLFIVEQQSAGGILLYILPQFIDYKFWKCSEPSGDQQSAKVWKSLRTDCECVHLHPWSETTPQDSAYWGVTQAFPRSGINQWSDKHFRNVCNTVKHQRRRSDLRKVPWDRRVCTCYRPSVFDDTCNTHWRSTSKLYFSVLRNDMWVHMWVTLLLISNHVGANL